MANNSNSSPASGNSSNTIRNVLSAMKPLNEPDPISKLDDKLQKNLTALQTSRKQITQISNNSKELSKILTDIVGEHNKIIQGCLDLSKGSSAVNNVLSNSGIDEALTTLTEQKKKQIYLDKYLNNQSDKIYDSLNKTSNIKVQENIFKKWIELKINYAKQSSNIDRESLQTTLNLTTSLFDSSLTELKKFVGEKNKIYQSLSISKDVSSALAKGLPNAEYNLKQYDIAKNQLDNNFDLGLLSLANRQNSGKEPKDKIQEQQLALIKKYNDDVFKLEQSRLKYQLELGNKFSSHLAGIANKYLSSSHVIVKSLNTLSGSFNVTQSILPSLYNGLHQYENKFTELENQHVLKQKAIEEKYKGSAELSNVKEYELKLEEQQYGSSIRKFNVEKDAYQYSEISKLFSGMSTVSAENFGESNPLTQVMGGLSSGFSLAESLTLGAGKLGDIKEEQEAANAKYDAELKLQKLFLEEKIINEEDYKNNVLEINKNMYGEQQNLQFETMTTAVDMYSQVTGSLANLTKQLTGENSKAYKAMFALNKAAAIAQIIINTEVAASKAGAETGLFGISMQGWIRGLGYASAAMVAAQTVAGMAHDGIDYVPREGTWLLDKGERVVDSRTNADLKAFLNSSSNSSGNGQLSINVPVNIGEGGGDDNDAKQLAMLVQVAVKDTLTKEMRPGGLLSRRT